MKTNKTSLIYSVLLIIILILFLFKCSSLEEPYIKEIAPADTLIPQDTVIYQQDSVLRLADEAMQQLDFKEDLRKNMLEQIQHQLQSEQLTKNQIQVLQQQSQSYQDQIKEHHRIEVVKKDSIVYNIQYRDTIICKPVYIPDTIYVEVVDTILVKKLKRKKRKKD